MAQFGEPPPRQCCGQDDGAKTHPLEAAHPETRAFKQLAHGAVLAVHQGDVVPVIAAAAVVVADIGEGVALAVDHHPIDEPLRPSVIQASVGAHGVLTVEPGGGVHHAVGQRAIVGQDQQPGGGDVQAAHRNPASLAQTGQAVEHGAPAFGIPAGANQTFRLVEDQHPGGAGTMTRERLAVEGDGVARLDALPQPRRLAIDEHAAIRDPLLDLAPRAVAHLGQGFLQPRRLLGRRVGHGS